MNDFIEFTDLEKAFILKRIKTAIDNLTAAWVAPLGPREIRITQAVDNVIKNLPSKPDKVPVHRRWWQKLGDW
jgi:hypothetical protein